MGKPIDRFPKVLGDFMPTIILQKYFKLDVIHFTDYGVIAEKTHVSHLPQIFRAPLGKTMRWIVK